MTSIQQRADLQRQIWQIANDVRGAVDGWDFKQYVLGTLFYRFISENFASYMQGDDESVNYAEMDDNSEILAGIKDDAIKTKGYFIYPSQLFANVVAKANTNESLNTDLAAIFTAIENSAAGYPSEQDIKGLFADFDTTSNRLGNTVKDKNTRLAAVLKGVNELNFGNFEDNHIDLFGDAYEFLISNYAANAGKSGGEFFTPQHVSKLLARLALHKQTSVNRIYDPACGSGSLLLQARKQFDDHIIEEGFFGQEINHTTYNLARMNMFLHNVNYDKFDIQLGDTLINPHFGDDKPFDAIVSNPPYSLKWIGADDPTLINGYALCPGRRTSSQVQGRLCLCAARAQLSFQQRTRCHCLFSWYFLPGWCRAENPAVSGVQQLCGKRDFPRSQSVLWHHHCRQHFGAGQEQK